MTASPQRRRQDARAMLERAPPPEQAAVLVETLIDSWRASERDQNELMEDLAALGRWLGQ